MSRASTLSPGDAYRLVHDELTLTHEGGNIPPLIEEQFMADLYAESEMIENDLNSWFGVYPVLKIGISFKI